MSALLSVFSHIGPWGHANDPKLKVHRLHTSVIRLDTRYDSGYVLFYYLCVLLVIPLKILVLSFIVTLNVTTFNNQHCLILGTRFAPSVGENKCIMSVQTYLNTQFSLPTFLFFRSDNLEEAIVVAFPTLILLTALGRTN